MGCDSGVMWELACVRGAGQGWGWGVAGCCFEPWRCVGSACNRKVGGAVGCRVGKGWGWEVLHVIRVELAKLCKYIKC